MQDLSIHPRRSFYAEGPVKNTSKPRGARSRKYDRKARRLNLRQTACAATKSSVTPKRATGFKTPGSMNQHKR